MLYGSFKVMVMIAAILGILHMVAEGSYVYIFFPIAIVIWATYTFFDENDREYLRRNGIDPDKISWFFPDYSDYGAVKDGSYPINETSSSHRRTYPTIANNNSWNGNMSADAQFGHYCPQQCQYSGYSNPEYRRLKDKCKRNFKITVSKEEENGTDGLQ